MWACDHGREDAKEGRAQPKESKGQPALKWLQVVRAPDVLTLHLKRFRSRGCGASKLSMAVPFPLSLDLAPFQTSADAPPKARSATDQPCARACARPKHGAHPHPSLALMPFTAASRST